MKSILEIEFDILRLNTYYEKIPIPTFDSFGLRR